MLMIESESKRLQQTIARFSTPREWCAIAFRRRRLALVSFCGVLLGAAFFSWFWAANYYESTMEILVEQDRSDPAITAAQNAAILTSGQVTPDQINSEVALIQGWDMLGSVVSSCGLSEKSLTDAFFPAEPARAKAIATAKATRHLAKALNVEVEKNADVIKVSYGKRGAPETPACVLDHLSKLYLEKHLQLRRPVGTSDFFAQQTDKYATALADAETRLADFGLQHGVVAPDVQRTDMAQQVVNSVAALHQARQNIAADEQRIKNTETQMATTPARSPTQQSSNSADVLMQQLQSTLLGAQIKRTQLLLKYEPTYPLVQEAEQEITQTNAAISAAQNARYENHTTDRDPTFELLREDAAKTRADLAAQRATAAALETSIKSMQSQMVDLDRKAVKQANLIREVKADESNYLLYLAKREQERTSDALDEKRIANVAIAVPPAIPALPAHSPWLVMAIGFLVAIFVSIGVTLLAEFLDPSFRTPAEVAQILNIHVLASVPRQAA
jgi:uncharacterized protein involved in exopolysaccharide biosynthesis